MDRELEAIPSGIMTTITFSRLDARSFALLEKLLLDLSGFCETSLPVLRGFVEDKRFFCVVSMRLFSGCDGPR